MKVTTATRPLSFSCSGNFMRPVPGDPSRTEFLMVTHVNPGDFLFLRLNSALMSIHCPSCARTAYLPLLFPLLPHFCSLYLALQDQITRLLEGHLVAGTRIERVVSLHQNLIGALEWSRLLFRKETLVSRVGVMSWRQTHHTPTCILP